MKSHSTYLPVREHQRFKAMQRALVLFPQSPEALPYHIIDISQGGLSFRYLGNKLKSSEISEINLYHEYELIVDSIPIEMISDYRLRDNLVPVRRGSLSFSRLDKEQKAQIETFIKSFTLPGQSKN